MTLLWRDPPANLVLMNGDVHVWRASLNLPLQQRQTLYRTLSLAEREKAARFHFDRDRDRYIVSHGVLRAILGYYLTLPPSRLRFCHNAYAKPALIDELGGRRLHFNMAHSHRMALYALTLDREIGIDLEHIRDELADQQVAERVFSQREVVDLVQLPENQQTRAFFNCWTRKEAYVKAKGRGLSIPLNQFDVSLAPGEPAELLSVQGDPQNAARWSMQAFNPAPDYVAALVVEGPSSQLKHWQWSR